MIYNQFIENYKEYYKKYKKWLKKETDHYVFYYLDDVFIKKEISKIARIQESANKKILKFLGINKSKKINYYIYSNEHLKSEFMGNSVYAQTVYKDNSVHIVYNKKIKPLGAHEDTHLISLKFGLATSFFAEGLAECIANKKPFNGKNRIYFIRKWLKKYKIFNLSDFFTQKSWLDTPDEEAGEFYSIAMFFTKHLIKSFGKEKFINFYKKINRDMTSEQIIHIMSEVFKTDYRQIISSWKIK
ncbi:MAG: hypothetical protein ABH971_00145 [bacterium]